MTQENPTAAPNPAPARPAGSVPISPADAKQLLYFILLVPGIFLSVTASNAYPLLDARVPLTLILLAFLFPVAFQAWSIALSRRGQRAQRARRARTVYVASSSALILLSGLLFLNGRFDRAPRAEVQAVVTRKLAMTGSNGKQYRLAVASPAGRQWEDLNVAADVYNRAAVGKTVTVEVHPGFLGFPWSGSVSPN